MKFFLIIMRIMGITGIPISYVLAFNYMIIGFDFIPAQDWDGDPADFPRRVPEFDLGLHFYFPFGIWLILSLFYIFCHSRGVKALVFILQFPWTLVLVMSWSEYGIKKEGLDIKFDVSGKKHIETHYKNGELEGLETYWYKSGKKKSETHYKNGKQEGLATWWYKSGKKKYLKHYKNGKENGLRKEWDEDGKLIYQGNFVDGAEEIK